MITLFIGIWLQPRNQPTFSVCQLPASSLASTFYSLKLCLSFPFSFSLPLPPLSQFFFPLPSLSQQIYLFVSSPRPPSFSFCMCSDFPGNSPAAADDDVYLLKKNQHSLEYTCTHDHAYIYIYIYICAHADIYGWLFHVDYLGMSMSGCNHLNICLLWAPSHPGCGNRSLWNQINYLCWFPQEQQNALLIANLYRRLEMLVPSDLKQHFSATTYVFVMEYAFSWHKCTLHGMFECVCVCKFQIFFYFPHTHGRQKDSWVSPQQASLLNNNYLIVLSKHPVIM